MKKLHALVPQPQSLELREGSSSIGPSVDVAAVAAARPAAEYLGALLERGAGIAVRYLFPDSDSVEIGGAKGAEGTTVTRIRFVSEGAGVERDELERLESYRLTIGDGEILIAAEGPRGFFWGVQTLRQLLPAEIEVKIEERSSISLPNIEISDAPRFAWRGLHFDVSRHFFSVGFIKKLIDLLAFYKLNTFHWHLTDDQGWRIEIKKYPELTSVGGYRRGVSGTREGGFYTQEQVREVVAYAAERGITVVPEIEMPGHARAAVAAYPWLSCSKDPIEVWSHGGISKDLFCAGREETFDFVENVLDEILDLFPSELIHIGGDECPKDHWKSCPDCQRRIQEEGLVDEGALQGYFVRRVQSYCARLGRRIVGWDEILEGGLAPGATVMSWRGIEGGVEAARAGHRAVMSPTSHCYFDYRQSANPGELGPTHFDPPVTTLRKVYAFEPIPEGLSEEQRASIIGSQGNVWTEDIDTEERAGYMIFPRIAALAEVLWTASEQRDWQSFKQRLAENVRRLDLLSVAYCRILESLE